MTLLSGLTAFIFARGGSKRVPRKNALIVAGKPLIAHSIQCALASASISHVIVSTDDAEIARISTEYGASVLERPADLATDTSSELLSWRHAINSFPQLFAGDGPQPFISLPATSPLRAPADVDGAIARFSTCSCDILFGISPSHNSPYLNMVTITGSDLIETVISGNAAIRTQDVPQVYDITTSTYVARADYVLKCQRLSEGEVGYYLIPPERALDVDSRFDMYLAELMLTHPYQQPK
jgi:CMP-N-acetylneuraminic acid synthetase